MNFFKKNSDKYAVAKAAVKIIVRRVLLNNPAYSVPLQMICDLINGNDVLTDVVDLVFENNAEALANDATLKADVEELVGLIGLNDEVIDRDKVTSIASVLCGLL